MRIEEQILANLLCNEDYARKCLPFLESVYFKEKGESALIQEVSSFFTKHNQLVTKDILKIELANRKDMNDTVLESTYELVDKLTLEKTNTEWLTDQTEKFCKQQAIYNAILRSIKIIEGDDPKFEQDAIPSLLSEALGVSFNTEVGHNYVGDAENRWEFYNRKEEKIPFDLKMLNKITDGGMSRKAVYCVGAQSGGGKSLLMTHVGASTLRLGKNVLYITMEMAEERIAERIDANMMRVDIGTLKDMSRDTFMTKVDKIQAKTDGKLFIKEYPAGSAHVGHFRALMEELKVKQDFVPDLVIIDYLGICASSRMKMGGSVNSYSYIKAIAEELRGFATEFNVPILTGAQLNRSGFDNSDVDLSNTADSMGLVMTLDVFFALIRTDELDEQNSIMVKQLKNRYSDVGVDKRFLVGINRPKMTFYDLEDSAQGALLPEATNKTYAPKKSKPEEDKPLFDISNKNKTLDTSNWKF
jgi:DnaB-like helicase C terminal domain